MIIDVVKALIWCLYFQYQTQLCKPLYDLTTIVNLISHTTTNEGLIVRCAVDDTKYEKGIKVWGSGYPNSELVNGLGQWAGLTH